MLPFAALAVVVCSIIVFWTATVVISGQLFPTLLQPFYALFPAMWMRMLLLTPLYITGNILIAQAFVWSASTAAVTAVCIGTFMPVAMAMVVSGTKLNAEIMLAGVAVLAACLWLHFALTRATG